MAVKKHAIKSKTVKGSELIPERQRLIDEHSIAVGTNPHAAAKIATRIAAIELAVNSHATIEQLESQRDEIKQRLNRLKDKRTTKKLSPEEVRLGLLLKTKISVINAARKLVTEHKQKYKL